MNIFDEFFLQYFKAAFTRARTEPGFSFITTF